MHLWDLVDDISRELFSEWLGVIELGLLDTAICNVKLRTWITRQLQSVKNIPLYGELDRFYPSESIYKWIRCRKLMISTLMPLDCDFGRETELTSYFQLIFIRKIIFSGICARSTILGAIANACISLVSFECDDPVVFSIVSTDLLSRLTCLNCDSVNKNCLWEDLVDALSAIKNNCRQLKNFEFVSDHFTSNVFVPIPSILESNRLLETLCLTFDNTIFDALESCSNLKSFTLMVSKGSFPFRQISQLIKTRRIEYLSCDHRRKFEHCTYRNEGQWASIELYSIEEALSELEEVLSELPALKKITISFSSVSRGMMTSLSSHLTSLDLRCCKVEMPLSLGRFPSLSTLLLERCQFSGEDIVGLFCSQPLPLLRNLFVSEVKLTISIVVKILTACNRLTECEFHSVLDDTPLYPEAREQVVQLLCRVPNCQLRFGWNNGVSCLKHQGGEYWTEFTEDFQRV